MRSRRRDDEGPLQLKPLILSVVHGLQLVGVQLRSAPAQVNQFWGPAFLSQLPCMQYGRFAQCFDLSEVAAPPLDMVTARVIRVIEEIFFLEHTPNDSPG